MSLPSQNPGTAKLLTRRDLSLRLVAALAVSPFAGSAAWAQTKTLAEPTRMATPSQTEGPYYPVKLPQDTDFDLLKNGDLTYAKGQACWLEGQVLDLKGKAVRGAQVEIWQCDQAGRYNHPADNGLFDKAFQGFGKAVVNADGYYRFHTIRPVAYASRAPHIHVKVKLDRRELLTTQLYLAGEPLNQRDALWQTLSVSSREALTVDFTPSADGLRGRFDIVVAA